MAWEWLAPLGTVAAAGVSAGFGGWYAGRKTQERQHKFERETNVLERGREKADDAIAALRVLLKFSGLVADWHLVSPRHDPDDEAQSRDAYERLGGAVEYLTDPVVRRQIEFIYIVLEYSFLISKLGDCKLHEHAITLLACKEGLAILGRYLRDEPAQKLSQDMREVAQALNGAGTVARRIDEELKRADKT
jgi:hypothetical protein